MSVTIYLVHPKYEEKFFCVNVSRNSHASAMAIGREFHDAIYESNGVIASSLIPCLREAVETAKWVANIKHESKQAMLFTAEKFLEKCQEYPDWKIESYQ